MKKYVFIGLTVIAVLAAVSYFLPRYLMSSEWRFTGEGAEGKWQASRRSTACPEPLLAMSPVDLTKATAILYPGQYRGMDYKPHGGIGFADSRNDEITVRLPMEARLAQASRYIQNGEVQYLLEFRHDCGVAYRFDHLLTLSPVFQEIINRIPEARPDDSRTTPLETEIFPVGTVVATAVGLPSMQNVGLDFGVSDLRQPNSISTNSQWAQIHQSHWTSDAYGVCWFDLLSATDQEYISRLEAQYGVEYPIERAVSDYCEAPGGTTLQYDNGRPVPEAR